MAAASQTGDRPCKCWFATLRELRRWPARRGDDTLEIDDYIDAADRDVSRERRETATELAEVTSSPAPSPPARG
jgi:hypothetical protein